MPDPIADAVRILRGGGLVAMPTETVYGLAADARNPAAVRAIFARKGRPADHPLIVHLPRRDALDDWARESGEWPGTRGLHGAHTTNVVTAGS